MYTYTYGGKNGTTHALVVAKDRIAVRTNKTLSVSEAVVSPAAQQVLEQFSHISQFPEADVFVLQGQAAQDDMVELRDRARVLLSQEEEIRFAGRVLQDPHTETPVLYSENFFVKFRDDLKAADCKKLLAKHELTAKERLRYAKNAYFVAAVEGTGVRIFQIAQDLLNEPAVELCHPELIRPQGRRLISSNQWHLRQTTINGAVINAHVHVEGAWRETRGAGVTVALIDDGVDIDHQEFALPNKIVAPRDITLGVDDPRPKRTHPDPTLSDNHGTACAGVVVAAGIDQAVGVAPEAKLMPLRMVSGLGSRAEADAFYWAARNGADVISCSWGPQDGAWWNSNDVLHQQEVALPDMTREAIDYALTRGRNGKGCVIVWAAGNGNENVENDGYASYDPIIAVAAVNERNRRSIYSDFGASIWCSFPSNDIMHAQLNPARLHAPGIWTADRAGMNGYNPGLLNPQAAPPGDNHGHYTATFGGTSSACPGVAGVVALILAANPALHHREVKQILQATADRIDIVGGSYDAAGHSPFYGYGLCNAERAVQAAVALRDGTARIADELAVFDAITIKVGQTPVVEPRALAQKVVAETLDGQWRLEPVEHEAAAFDLFYTGRAPMTISDAWEITYRLRDHRDVVLAEPSFVTPTPGVITENVDAALITPRSAFGAATHLPETDGNYEWSLKQVKALNAWELASPSGKQQGEGIRIGHPDSGYRQHPELDQDRLALNLAIDLWDGDADPNDDDGNHGLGTGSVIMSGVNRPANRPFVTGVAPKAELVPIRVTKVRGIIPAPVLFDGGMRRLRRAVNHAVDNGCHVISISLGGPLYNEFLERALQRAVAEGVIVLAAAGNEVRFVVYPALYDEVIAVAACNIEGKPWAGSCRGSAVDVTAPGESVWKATINGNGPEVVRENGTSFAVATAAGVAALWLSYHGRDHLVARYGKAGIVPVFKEILIKHGADPSPHLDSNEFGAGIINAVKVLQAPLPDTPPARGMSATGRSPLRANSPTARFQALFEDVPHTVLHAELVDILSTNSDDLPVVLAEVGDELAFRLAIDPNLHRRVAVAMTSNGGVTKMVTTIQLSADEGENLRQQVAQQGVSSRLGRYVGAVST